MDPPGGEIMYEQKENVTGEWGDTCVYIIARLQMSSSTKK